jgi:pimeloyl-ACP methyl ester carboxylesterase
MEFPHRIVSGRAHLAATAVGEGDPVVFLHANVCDSRMWSAEVAAAGVHHRAIAYDRRGFGQTRCEAAEDFSAVADLVVVLDALADGRPAVLVGCSHGGRIALDAALLHPRRVRALLLVAPGASGAPEAVYPPDIQPLVDRAQQAEQAGDRDRANARKAHLWLDGPRQPEGRVGGAARRLFLEMNGIALRSPPTGRSLDTAPAFPRLGLVPVPTRLLWGDADFPHIQARCVRMVEEMPAATGHVWPGVAHLPSLERPAESAAFVLDFLEALRTGRR